LFEIEIERSSREKAIKISLNAVGINEIPIEFTIKNRQRNRMLWECLGNLR
jgi:hypothetical protein